MPNASPPYILWAVGKALAWRGFPLSFGALSAAILSAEWWIVHSYAFQRNPDLLAVAITFDIVAVIPALFYFLVLRPRKASPLFVLPCFGLCMLTASRILPAAHHQYLFSLRSLIPVLELALMLYILSRIPPFLRSYRELRRNSIYFTDAVFGSLRKMLPDRFVVAFVTVEVFLMYFAIAGWFLRWKGDAAGRQVFGYHRKAGYSAVLGILMMVMALETFAVHRIVSHWSPLWAWILTALSMYGVLWMLGDFHAIRLHPMVVEAGTLHLRIGLRWRADIPLQAIQEIRAGKPDNPRSKTYLRASVLWPRAVIRVKEPVVVEGLFGMRRSVTEIGVSVDDPEQLRRAVFGSE